MKSTLQESVFLGSVMGSPRLVRPDQARHVHVSKHARRNGYEKKGLQSNTKKDPLARPSQHNH